MDLTEGSIEFKQERAKKMMLWFGIASLLMSFAGWTSAYIVSRTRRDWLSDFELPQAFVLSTIIIVLSSVMLIIAKRALKHSNRQLTTGMLLITFLLGVAFIYFQFVGFSSIINSGFNFTGPTSNPKTSFIYVIAIVHIAHVIVGLLCLLVVIYNHFKQKYNPQQMLGFELAATFWHFVDILWVFLFLFLYFVR